MISASRLLTPPTEGRLLTQEANQGLGESIARIDAFLNQGKKLCLFVGRTPREPLPSDRGLATANEIWVSGDISNEGPAISKDRIHLCFDFNNQDLILKLQKRFDLIVIDLTVMKFFTEDFANRFSVMLHSPKSKMIFESTIGYMSSRANLSEPIFSTKRYMVTIPSSILSEIEARKEAYFDNYRATTPPEQQKLDRDAFMKEQGNFILESISHWSKYDQERELEDSFTHSIVEKAGIREDGELEKITAFARQQLKEHLEKTFAHVVLIENHFCAYWIYDCSSYFIISHPRKQASCCQLV